MTQEQEKLVREQMHKLLDIVIDTNGFEHRERNRTGTLPTVFLEYYGHVNKVQITISEDGWQTGASSTTLVDTSLDKPLPDEVMQQVEEQCKAALTDKKESDVLQRDIACREQAISKERQAVRNMKKKLKQLQKKESRTNASNNGTAFVE